jgi:hypothetical protein
MEVSGQLHAPAAGDRVGPKAGLDAVGETFAKVNLLKYEAKFDDNYD